MLLEPWSESRGMGCSTCKCCFSHCPGELELEKIMPVLRYIKGSRGAHRNMFDTMGRLSIGSNMQDWLKGVETDESSEIAYFPGCAPLYDVLFGRTRKYSGAAQAGVKVLNSLGIKPRVIYGCCGHDLYHSGKLDEFADLKEKYGDELKGTIVTGCAECYHMLKNYYDADVVFFTDFIKEKGVELPKLDIKTTYHDPCRLSRMNGVMDTPREMLSACSEFTEMERVREESQCCGVNSWLNCNAKSKEARLERLREAQGTGADVLVTSCPKCMAHFDCANYDVECEIPHQEIWGVEELVGKALGVYDPEANDPYEINTLEKQPLPEVKEHVKDPKRFIDDEFLDKVYNCTTCLLCTEVCYGDHSTKTRIEELRAALTKLGYGLPKHAGIKENLDKTGNVFAETTDVSHEDSNAEVLYFPGCVAKYRMTTVKDATMKILEALGVKYEIPRDIVCCGSVLYRTGYDATDLKKKNTDIMAGKKVIVSCSGCHSTLSHDYEGLDVQHIVQFLQGRLDGLPLKELSKKVAYHDPCHLGRSSAVYDEPRACISAVPGTELVEFPDSKEMAMCCGAGGGVKAAKPERADAQAKKRMDSLPEGVDVVLSACPFCKLNLGQNGDVPVQDICEYLLEALD